MYKLVPEKAHDNAPDGFCETFKSFLLHIVFEFIGTMLMTFAFICAGDFSVEQTGGYAVALMVSASISGGYCNPAITLACMMRKDSKRISAKLGLSYILVQYLGGFAASTFSLLIVKSNGIVSTEPDHWYTAIMAVSLGSFVMCFMYLTQTAKLTSFTDDIAISVFIVAGSYEVGQLIVTTSVLNGKGLTGNPAIDAGLTLTYLFKHPGDALKYIWLWPLVPFVGALLAFVFNELLYKKSLI